MWKQPVERTEFGCFICSFFRGSIAASEKKKKTRVRVRKEINNTGKILTPLLLPVFRLSLEMQISGPYEIPK